MNNYLPTDYQSFIATSRYARWLNDENRRENWRETVERFIANVVKGKVDVRTEDDILFAMLNLEVMPSMRSVDMKSFDEAMFILLCGTGVGFSVERQYIQKLPEIPAEMFESDTTIIVKDSKEGWAKALRMLIAMLYSGEVPKWDVSQVRPAGSKLKTFGGRASGPAPLVDLFIFVVDTFKVAKGRKLNSLEVHDIMCKIGEVVVVGGVRRSAMISLSNLSDDRLRHAKTGSFPTLRYLANNSVAYTEKPTAMAFMREWTALAESGSGERGIFNREASKKQAAKNGRRDSDFDFGTNPCSEIILRPNQFCNLTEVVVRETDTLETLERKVTLATILGTIQSSYTKFPYLRKVWQKNTEEERLLGVSLTGIMDNPLMTVKNKGLEETLDYLKGVAISVNAEWADTLGIPDLQLLLVLSLLVLSLSWLIVLLVFMLAIVITILEQ
jgi:ribonucleoside-triphosphate reductase (thioredoxin)